MNYFNISGKKAIVTGGCNGIGRAITEALLESGVKVVVFDIDKNLDKSIVELSTIGETYGIYVDINDRVQRKLAFEKAMEHLDHELDILVNNAGINKRSEILDINIEEWDLILEVNITAAFALSQMAGRYMVKQKQGKIINIASMNSFLGGTKVTPYAVSKGGIVQLTKAISNEWSEYGVNCNAIAPGFIETNLTSDMTENNGIYNTKLDRIPKGRWGKPEDIKGTVIFLCSPASDYICGVTIPIDGGYLAK